MDANFHPQYIHTYIMMIQNTRTPPTNKRSLSLTDYNKTHTDFNSRLIIGTPICDIKTNIIKFNHTHTHTHHHTSNHQSNYGSFNTTTSYNNSWNATQSNITNLNNLSYPGYFNYGTGASANGGGSDTNSIKLRLQKVLGKQTKNYAQPDYKGHRKIKSLFFKGNYKLNKNKKQLEELNKKHMADIIHRENQQLKKHNRANMFMIKQIKPIKFKTTGTNMLSASKNRNAQYDYQDEFQLLQLSNNVRQQNRKEQPSKQKEKQMRKVLQYFDRYDKNGYKPQQKRQINEDLDVKLGFNTLKGKMKRRITIRNKKNQEYQPWDLDHSCESPDHF